MPISTDADIRTVCNVYTYINLLNQIRKYRIDDSDHSKLPFYGYFHVIALGVCVPMNTVIYL